VTVRAHLFWVYAGLVLEEAGGGYIISGQFPIVDCLPVPCRTTCSALVEYQRRDSGTSEAVGEKERCSPSRLGTASVNKDDTGVQACPARQE
jgi:hypothetical protein